jgi:hypothetical protein
MLAMSVAWAAYCVSNGTATLLLVVDWYSQVVSAAVHQYSHLIRTLTLPHRHDSTKTRNSARFT